MTTSPILATRGLAPRAVSLLSYIILLGGVITIGVALYLVVVSYSSLPYWDGWTQIFASQDGNPNSIGSLWAQHNEHRLPIPKLFLLADLRWFHARQIFLLTSIFVTQGLLLLQLAWSMRVFGGWRGAVWRTGVGLTAFCVFCPSQWENLVWGFQVCFVLPGLFATASFIGLLLSWKSSGGPPAKAQTNWRYLALSIAAALGATWSLSNGNLLWPLLVAAAVLVRLRIAALSYAIAGTISTVVYLFDYIHPTYALNSVKTPAATLKYLFAYFGSSWPGYHFRLAEFLGLVGIGIFLLLLWRLPVFARTCRAFDVLLVLTLAFCFGTGGITALGRSGFGIGQAFTARYQTVALLFWCCLGLLLLGVLSSLRRARDAALAVTQLAILAIMLLGAKHATVSLTGARLHGFRLNAAAMSLVTDVPDPEQLKWAFWNPDTLFTVVPYMRQGRLSVFDDANSWLIGKPLESAFGSASSNECTGEVESTVPMRGVAGEPLPLRIAGWAWDDKQRQAPSTIVAATDGIITGLAAVSDWRPLSKNTYPWMTTNYIGYTAYVQEARSSGPVEIYAILQGSPARACLIGTVK